MRRRGSRQWSNEEHYRERAVSHTEHAAPTCSFDPVTHTYTIGDVIVPSVSQVLTEERFIDYKHIPDRTLTVAQARGTYVHQVLHYHLEGDFDLDDCDPRYRGYVDSALHYLDGLHKRPLETGDSGKPAVEFRFWHLRRMFAGTTDHVGYDVDDVLAIDDWKTGEPADVAAPLQLAGYELGVRDCLVPLIHPPYTKTIRRRAVKLFADGRPGRPEVYTDVRDLAMFLNALTCVHFRRNGMRHPE